MQTKVNELLWIPYWEQLQHHRIGHAEDCGIRADAKRQREHGDNGEAWILQKQANGVAQVLPRCVHLGFSIFTRSATQLADRLAWRAARVTTQPKMRSRRCCPTRSAVPADREAERHRRHWRSLGLLPKRGSTPRPSPRPAATSSCPAQDELPESAALRAPCGRRFHACAWKPHKQQARECPSLREQWRALRRNSGQGLPPELGKTRSLAFAAAGPRRRSAAPDRAAQLPDGSRRPFAVAELKTSLRVCLWSCRTAGSTKRPRVGATRLGFRIYHL